MCNLGCPSSFLLCSNMALNKQKRARCLHSPCTTLQGPLQPTLALIRSENDACFRSDTSAGSKQMVPGERYLLVLQRGLNLLCWFTFRFTPCYSGWAFLNTKCPKSPWNHRGFDWGILYDVNQQLSWTSEGTGRFLSALSFEVKSCWVEPPRLFIFNSDMKHFNWLLSLYLL